MADHKVTRGLWSAESNYIYGVIKWTIQMNCVSINISELLRQYSENPLY